MWILAKATWTFISLTFSHIALNDVNNNSMPFFNIISISCHFLWELYTMAPNFKSCSGGCLRRNHTIHQLGLNNLQSRNWAYFSPDWLISTFQNTNLSGLNFEMEESAKALLSDSSILKFSPERFVFWNVKINRSGLKYAQFLLWRLFSPSWCILWFQITNLSELNFEIEESAKVLWLTPQFQNLVLRGLYFGM